MQQKAFDYIDNHKEDMIALWKDLVMQESFYEDKENIDKIAEKLKKEFEIMGGKAQIHHFDKAGGMLVGEYALERVLPPIAFLGHMDTVCLPGTIEKRPFSIKDGVAYGPGVLDMKAGVVMALYIMKALINAGYKERGFKWLLAGDEENGHPYSSAVDLFEKNSQGCAAAFDMETGFVDNRIVVQRKGVARYTLEIKGISAHVGNDPENGRSAILEMAHKIIAIQKLSNFETGVTYNCGTIVGGTVPNAVPDYCKMVIDVRHPYVKDIMDIEKALKEITENTIIAGTTSTLTKGATFKPMERTDGVMWLFDHIKQTSLELGLDMPTPITSGGGSDAAYSVVAGVPTLCSMGVKGGRNHSPEEFAVVDTMFERCKLLIASILKLRDYSI